MSTVESVVNVLARVGSIVMHNSVSDENKALPHGARIPAMPPLAQYHSFEHRFIPHIVALCDLVFIVRCQYVRKRFDLLSVQQQLIFSLLNHVISKFRASFSIDSYANDVLPKIGRVECNASLISELIVQKGEDHSLRAPNVTSQQRHCLVQSRFKAI